MKKVLISLLSVGVVAVVAVFATQAFFSDTEESFGNVLQAGALDLKIDSEAHYAGLVCVDTVDDTPQFQWQEEVLGESTRPELIGEECFGTWELKDLEEGDVFFNLTDLKPGDEGENTISLHVFDNDAWGRLIVRNLEDKDNDCTEPETESSDPECSLEEPGDTPILDENGELVEGLDFHLWLDEGSEPGFQCYTPEGREEECDPTEGDNIQQEYEENTTAQSVFVGDEITVILYPGLAEAYGDECLDENGQPLLGVSPDGHNDYGLCHGLAEDGRLVGSTTYYIGVAWELDPDTGNEAQTDSVRADIAFEVEQHRNNPSPFPSP